MERKKWFETVDFYALTGLVCLWVSSWLLMYPHRMLVEVHLFAVNFKVFINIFETPLLSAVLRFNGKSSVTVSEHSDIRLALKSIWIFKCCV